MTLSSSVRFQPLFLPGTSPGRVPDQLATLHSRKNIRDLPLLPETCPATPPRGAIAHTARSLAQRRETSGRRCVQPGAEACVRCA